MSLLKRLFGEDAALEPKRKPLRISDKFELSGAANKGPLDPKPVSAKPVANMIRNVSARPVATGKEGHVFGKALRSESTRLTFELVDAILLEAKKKGFISQEISHLMHGKASRGPLKGKHVPQKQAIAVAFSVARRKGLKVPARKG